MTDPTRISDPAVRALAREVTALRRELDTVKAGQRASQLGHSSVDDGSLWFTDAAGIKRVSIGKQVDGKFGWGAVNGEPPPRPTPPQLDGTVNGVTIGWDGQFIGAPPSDFTHVKAYLSPVGAAFIPSEGNVVGHLLGNAKLPVTPLDAGTNYWCVLIAYNTSGVPSEPSIVQGPVQPSAVVSTEILDGIVTETKLAEDAVTAAKIAAGAVGTTQLAGGAVDLSKLADGSVDAAKLIDGAVTGSKIVTGAVGADQIAANAVVAGKIAADSVTSTNIVAGGVQTANLAADSVAAGKVAADAVTSREIQALSILADKIAANQIQAGHIEAGAITADKLAAILVLASQIIAGDPEGWHLELGDSNTPILFWDNEDTGFAVSRDEVTGQSNVYMSGRVEFGNGSQIEQDYLDLCEQPSAGFQTPKLRQQRVWLDSGPTTGVTARWISATQRGSLCLMAVFQTAASGAGAPNCGTPTGATIVDSRVSGPNRLTLFMVQNAPTSRFAESFGSSAGAARWAITLIEYSGIAADALDMQAFAAGTGSVASTGTTGTTTQGRELQVAVYGARNIGYTNGKNGQWTNPTNGFAKTLEGDGFFGHGIAVATRNATGTSPVSSTLTANKSVSWIGLVATFRTAAADGIPSRPPTTVTRLFTLRRGGKSTPHIIDDGGAVYPVGRAPYTRVYLTVDAGYQTSFGNLFAQGDWAVGLDPYGMAAIGTGGVFSNITIPITGNYLVDYKALYPNAASPAHLACMVTKNSRDTTASVARDIRAGAIPPASTDGSPVQATRVVPLAAGDVLYWANWSDTNTAILAGRNNIPTEITVHYLGPS